MKEQPFNCFWSHTCRITMICCHFCKKKNCEWRCLDEDYLTCKYKDDIPEEEHQGECVAETIQEVNPETKQEEVRTEVKSRPSICKFWG